MQSVASFFSFQCLHVSLRLHIQLCFKRSISLVSSLFEVQFVHEKNLLLVECCFCNGSLWFDFTCTSCIICYHATQIVVIVHILHFVSPIIICTVEWLPWDSHDLSILHIHFHTIGYEPFVQNGEEDWHKVYCCCMIVQALLLLPIQCPPSRYWIGEVLDQLAYNLNVPLSDFHLCGPLKKALRSSMFSFG